MELGQDGTIGDIERVDIDTMNIRPLQRDEVSLIWQIDRREIVENIYRLRDGNLILVPDYFDIQGWPPGKAELYTPIFLDCHDRGGIAWGAFENGKLVGTAILEREFIGTRRDTLQLKFLHVSRDYRKQGLGRTLFNAAVEKAKALGCRKVYICATPSENTINYYLRLGCVLTTEINAELFALEPEDIHLEYVIS